MDIPSKSDTFRNAVQDFNAGRLAQAELALASIADSADAWHLRGLIARRLGDAVRAIEFFGKAIQINATNPHYHRDMGLAYVAVDQPHKVTAAFREVVALMPGDAVALNNLGTAYRDQGLFVDAAGAYRQAIELKADYALAHNNLGNIYRELGRMDEAIASYQSALVVNPDYVEAMSSLGFCFQQTGMFVEAIACHLQCTHLQPNAIEGHNNLGNAYKTCDRMDEAIACYQMAIALKPDAAQLHYNLGVAYLAHTQPDAAIASYCQALLLNPDYAEAHLNLGNLYFSQGKHDEALQCFRQALGINADLIEAHGNLLYCMNYHPSLSASEIFDEYGRWNRQHAHKFHSDALPMTNLPTPQRRLKIAYVSPDFRNHSVMHFVAPLIELADKANFDIHCYYNHTQHDAYTARIIAATNHWTSCVAMSDAELAQRIREDGIDILIDLAGHTTGNRLLVFARRPAPVQATCFGYGYTTGLSAMDYFIGDPVFTPPESAALFSESIIRMPHCFAAYLPPVAAPLPGESPALRNGYVTFACLSRYERINERVLEAWVAILRRLPQARLRLDSSYFDDARQRQEVQAKLSAMGIPPPRVHLGFTTPVWSVYQEVDIVLDCFPHNSGTTTFEALWMGVPVVTLADRPSVGRIGASILSGLGAPQWIATDVADYVNRAVLLAQDISGLVKIRAELRQSMARSPLLDQAAYVRNMEAAYREMWKKWCAENSLSV